MRKILIILTTVFTAFAAQAQEIELQWIGQAPDVPAGQSWGVPFQIGQVQDGQQAILTDGAGQALPLQQ